MSNPNNSSTSNNGNYMPSLSNHVQTSSTTMPTLSHSQTIISGGMPSLNNTQLLNTCCESYTSNAHTISVFDSIPPLKDSE